MKRILYNIITLTLIAVSGLGFVSCEQSSSDAVPVVRFVRPIDPVNGDMLMTEVAMGSNIAIIGENLGDVVKITFNDQVSRLNPAMVTPTSIIVSVPSTMPEVVTNKMYLETSSGKTAEFDLAVIIPSPNISSISCLYAPIGSDLIISGRYFFAREEDGLVDVVFPGNIPAEVKSVTEEEIVCTVPEGATIEGPIAVTSAYGTSRTSFNWRTTEGIFITAEADEIGTWNGWGMSQFGTENGCDGQYVLFEGTIGSWAWPDNKIQLYYINPTGEPLISEGEVSDYALEFEYCIESWSDTPFLIWFSAHDGAHNVDGEDAQYHWRQWQEEVVPGEWRTKTIPLTDFNTDKEEKNTRSITSLNDVVDLHMMPFGAADGASDLKMKIDNVRIVSI